AVQSCCVFIFILVVFCSCNLFLFFFFFFFQAEDGIRDWSVTGVQTCALPILMKALLFLSLLFVSQDWPEFRGPTGQGHSDERGLPLTWSETRNVRWKTAIPGRGWSSPSIQGDRIWLTTATEEGKSLPATAIDR